MKYSYCINSDYIIEYVDDNFGAFAKANGAANMADQVIGASLLDFMSDPEVRVLYTSLIDRVFADKTTLRVPLRCDSPDRKRYMSLEISYAGEQKVRLSCHLEREE